MRCARASASLRPVVIVLLSAFAGAFLASAPLAAQSSSSSSSVSSGTSNSSTSSKKQSKKRRLHHEPSQKAPTPDRISEIESALHRGGYYQGDPNGKWDANTVAAMQKFQSANGLEPTGKLDALSLQKLGLGSSTAGVSAPKPPAPTCCSTPSSSSSAHTCCSNSAASSPNSASALAPDPKAAAAPPKSQQ
jgi:peptidoglycan hydrolase-like protein with peptidoglycan-binding domain